MSGAEGKTLSTGEHVYEELPAVRRTGVSNDNVLLHTYVAELLLCVGTHSVVLTIYKILTCTYIGVFM